MTSAAEPLHVVIGASGQIGRHVVKVLRNGGQRVRGVGRQATLLADYETLAGDVGDPVQAARLCQGAHVVYACFGGPHATWAAQFPAMVRGVIEGAKRAGARLVFADNMYAYGPQPGVLTEDTTPKPEGPKQRLRAEMAELFLEQHRLGNLPVALARASDLYGPGVNTAMVDARFVRTALAGGTLRLPGDPSAAHTFSFAPDVARALVRLGSSEDAWGEIWHVPSAPAVSLRNLAARIGQFAGVNSRVISLHSVFVKVAALFDRNVRELLELSYQWDSPYLVSHAKFAARYGLEPTSLETGLRMTVKALTRSAALSIPG
jgi:nucleoside-diphosphate-sugar epimerase